MFYAVKSVEGQMINQIIQDWDSCKTLVYGKQSVYRACETEEDAKKFLITSYSDGVEQIDMKAKSVTGAFMYDLFRDKRSGYSICVFKGKRGRRITMRGYGLPDNKRLYYYFGGHFVNDKKYGLQFEVESFKEILEDTREGVVAYLSSGVMKGVGKKKAEAIYEKFGPKTMQILTDYPERLQYVKGFSKKSAQKAIEQLMANQGAREITQYFMKFGLSQKYAMLLYTRYGANAMNVLKERPYMLCRENGITFEDADLIAKDLGYPMDSKDRILYAAMHVLTVNEQTGDTGMLWENFTRSLVKLLGDEVEIENIKNVIDDMRQRKMLVVTYAGKADEKPRPHIFLRRMFDMEENIAKNIMRIKEDTGTKKVEKCERELTALERVYGFHLDDVQRSAVKKGLEGDPFLVITGGPGTGKTSIIRMIADLYSRKNNKVLFFAPTGRAARRITETTGREASTIHSYLHMHGNDDMYEEDNEIIIENTLVVVDEVSMVDTYVADKLFSSIGKGCRVIMIGDVDQLPSVGPGAVLRDIINSKAVDVIRLKHIYRQNCDDQIAENAAKINEGRYDLKEGSDFKIHETKSMEDVRNLMAERYLTNVKKYGLGNAMCLCPTRKNTAGTNDMNKLLQSLINPHEYGKNEIVLKNETLREGDLVMHLKNNDKASNGDIGIIKEINEDEESIIVHINKKDVLYDGEDDLKELTLAYATTIHKSQGSEADAVIFCMTKAHRPMLYRNLPYVAISRGKKMVEFIGEKEAIEEAANNVKSVDRITLLERKLRYLSGGYLKL